MQYFWFFLAIAGALGLQLFFSARQAKAFMAGVRSIRGKGRRVGIGMGGRKTFGRRLYVAVAADSAGRVVDAIELRGITQFARPKPLPALVGHRLGMLAGPSDIPGCDSLERDAARQAAQTLNTSGGRQPAGGAEDRKEAAPLRSLLRK
jgi:glucitol operon activator protein